MTNAETQIGWVFRKVRVEVAEKELDGECKLQHALKHAERSVINADSYVCDKASFLKLKHVGPKISEVQTNLLPACIKHYMLNEME